MQIKQKKCDYHFVEVMACPSGCLNGGGQIKPTEGTALSVAPIYMKKHSTDMAEIFAYRLI